MLYERQVTESDDLDEDLREQGVETLEEVKETQLERSGKLSVIGK